MQQLGCQHFGFVVWARGGLISVQKELSSHNFSRRTTPNHICACCIQHNKHNRRWVAFGNALNSRIASRIYKFTSAGGNAARKCDYDSTTIALYFRAIAHKMHPTIGMFSSTLKTFVFIFVYGAQIDAD